MLMPGHSLQGDYRYNYQGQELDTETGKVAFELRLYDPRINRWLTTDPAGQYFSPYLAMGNNWVNRIDPSGGSDCPPGQICTGTVNKLDEVTVTGTLPDKFRNNGWTSEVVTDFGGSFSNWMDQHGTALGFKGDYNQVSQQYNKRFGNSYISPKMNSLEGVDFERFVHNWNSGALNWKPGDMGYDLQLISSVMISTPMLATSPVTAAYGSHLFSNLALNTGRMAIINGVGNFGGQVLSNGGRLDRVDYFDVAIATALNGQTAVLAQAVFDYDGNFSINTGSDIVMNYVVETAVSSHSGLPKSWVLSKTNKTLYDTYFNIGANAVGEGVRSLNQ